MTLLLAVLAASAPSAGAALRSHHETSSASAAEHAPSRHTLSVGLPVTSPVVPTPGPSSTPTTASTATTGTTAATSAPGASPLPASTQQRSDVVYLTFDDGPDPHWTPQILALLARYHVQATFFEIGAEVRRHPQTAALVRASGQRIGSHSAHHLDLTALTAAQLHREITGGAPGATCLRPPFGTVNSRVRSAAAAMGQSVVLWNVDTDDWMKPGAKAIASELLRHARPGRTVLMHDGGGDRAQTLAALTFALPRLVARGYQFAAVPGC